MVVVVGGGGVVAEKTSNLFETCSLLLKIVSSCRSLQHSSSIVKSPEL